MFFFGFAAGIITVIIVLGIYLRKIEKSREKELDKILKNLCDQDAIDEEVKEIVLSAKKRVLKLDNFGFENNLKNLKEVSMNMAVEISKKYNPESKYPHLELTFHELLKLNLDITQFLLENLEKNYFTHLKKAKVCHLFELNDVKEKHFSKLEKGGRLYTLARFFMNPVGEAVKKAVTAVAVPVAMEALFKLGGNYGIERLGKELNLIYSGHYSKKEEGIETLD